MKGTGRPDTSSPYTPAGGVAQIAESMRKQQDGLYHSATFTYSYNNRGGLAGASRVSDDTSTDWNFSFTYDRYGNMLSKMSAALPNVFYTPDAATNRLSNYRLNYNIYTNYQYNLSHDVAGNVVSDGSNGYSYDALALLRQVNAGQKGNCRYDVLYRRVQKAWNYEIGGTQPTGALERAQALLRHRLLLIPEVLLAEEVVILYTDRSHSGRACGPKPSH